MKTTLLLFLIPVFAFPQSASFQASSGDTKQRSKTVHDLADQGPDAIPKLAPYVTDPDLGVRTDAVKGLVEIGGPKTVDALLVAARDPDPEMQIRATDGLVNVYLPGYVKNGMSGTIRRAGNGIKAKFGSDAHDLIIEPYVDVRPEVIAAIGKIARGGASVEARANAARAIGVLRGRAALPDLVEAMHSKDTPVMYEALMAVQKIRDPSAAPDIVFLMHDLADKIQIAAIETTGILRNREAAPDLREVLDRTRDKDVRRAALTALAMLAGQDDRARFQRYLTDKDEDLRAAAAEGLGRLKNPEDRTVLSNAFNNEHKMNPRLSDAFALVSLGNVETSQFSPLTYLVNTLNNRSYRDVASPFLTELARDPKVRQALYPMLAHATKDEKIQLSIVLARSGDHDSLSYLQTLSTDPDTEVAQEGIRSLRTLRDRLR